MATYFRLLTDIHAAPDGGLIAVMDEDVEFQRFLIARNIPVLHDDFRTSEDA